jgi:hypothetical protein
MSASLTLYQQLIAGNLRVGSVIHKYCDFTTPPKNKYMLVASVEPKFMVLMINSRVNQHYVTLGQDVFHVKICKAEHEFLAHDSHANCIEAHSAFDLSDIRQELFDNYTQLHKGWITDSCLEEVYIAVRDNIVMRTSYKKAIMHSIESKLIHLEPQAENSKLT